MAEGAAAAAEEVAGAMTSPMTQVQGRMAGAAGAAPPTSMAQTPETALALQGPALPAASTVLPPLDRVPA